MAVGDGWPLVLAGPWLRSVSTTQVSVFLAFRAARTVTVTVSARSGGGAVATSPTTPTVALGSKLHVVVATAVASAAPLTPGVVYDYDVSWTTTGTDAFTAVTNLQDAGLRTAATGVVYADGARPSFSLPPSDITKVNLIHGSCRKAHSEGVDALATLDGMISSNVGNADARPHQLFLTGDQIYADDVADPLLSMLTAAGDVLLGWTEQLPGVNQAPSALKPGKRTDVVTKTDGTGAGVTTDPEVARSHLLGVGEFYAMYLFAFSPAAWPATIPGFADVFPTEAQEYAADKQKLDEWNQEDTDLRDQSPPAVRNIELKALVETQVASVTSFKAKLSAVRRALANVPSYTICDDHEVTDDWYMNKEWCTRVLGQPLGIRLVRNALLAYAIFQAWGNTPDRFATGQPGSDLLTLAASATAPSGFTGPNDTALKTALNIPTTTAGGSLGGLTHAANTLDWHYKVAIDGAPYEVLVFDCRTWRRMPGDPMDPPELIGPAGFTAQVQSFGTRAAGATVTIAVVPGPVFDLPYMTDLKERNMKTPRGFAATLARKDNFVLDREPWDGQVVAQQRLLGHLFARNAKLVTLAGDVHFGFTARMAMWATNLFEHAGTSQTGVMAQFTCSPLCNEDHSFAGSYKFTTGGFDRATLDSGTVPDHLDVAGWNNPQGNVNVGRQKNFGFWTHDYHPWNLTSVPALLKVNDIPSDAHMNAEDWRYRVDYLVIDTGNASRSTAVGTKKVPPGTNADALKNGQELLINGGGAQVVGANNIGRIQFLSGTGGVISAVQELWWRVEGQPDPKPFSTWTVSLSPNDPGFPKPPKLPGVP
jgi:hypothetical protein